MSVKKNPNVYVELNELYTRSIDLVTELDETVRTYRECGGCDIVKDRAAADELITIVEKDVKVYREKIETLHAEHKDWTGKPKRPNRFMECHSIGNDYLNVVNSIITASMPVAAELIYAMNEGVE